MAVQGSGMEILPRKTATGMMVFMSVVTVVSRPSKYALGIILVCVASKPNLLSFLISKLFNIPEFCFKKYFKKFLILESEITDYHRIRLWNLLCL